MVPALAVTAMAGGPGYCVRPGARDMPLAVPLRGTKTRGLIVRPGDPVTAVTAPAGAAAVTAAVHR